MDTEKDVIVEEAEKDEVIIDLVGSEKAAAALSKKEKIKKEIIEWVKDIAVAVIIAMLILQFIMPTIVKEHSMENTLIANDYVFVSKKAYTWFGSPQRGDIIVFQSDLTLSDGTNKLLIKRIIGLPGDKLSITGGVVYLNGEALDEPYTKDGYTLTEMAEITVPEGSLFCMGDNRQNSADSRDSRIGCVELERVKGKAVLRIFPLNKFGGLYK